jgi:diaminopimelate decarboxylase
MEEFMSRLNSLSNVDTQAVLRAAGQFGSPLYLYDEQLIIDKCKALFSLPNAFPLL